MKTLNEVAQMFRVSRRTINRWVETRKLSVIRFSNGTVRVRDSAIEDLIKSRTIKAV